MQGSKVHWIDHVSPFNRSEQKIDFLAEENSKEKKSLDWRKRYDLYIVYLHARVMSEFDIIRGIL